ncbi:SGNH/GDSL hydrolase family protein [Curtobacterium sp. VKM Ac-2922]|uniref:SGNH/GDSL hydrolase family protein n=1 Tax=Curtobacterium sp. VKM Ac-2922 TaxID=2929475 RepID=UPI001FB3017D|nr:SGNH/GDSL hydrolase family protein [Curtobacterium sp. VKM Ac-2922]MCJ1714465.1 SGNH/GDSL hydrolase family protein [Curtobacterium sp. VKM Ac-2922]
MQFSRTLVVSTAMTLTVVVGLIGWDAATTTTATSATAGTSTAPGVANRTGSASSLPQTTAQGAPVTSDTAVVTIGDSIMAGHGLDDPSDAWPVLLGTETGQAVTNDSCSGAGFIAVGDCGTDYDGLLAAAVASAPGTVLVESSDNDLGQDPTALAAATTSTIAALHAALPHARIVGLSTLWDQPGTVPDEVAASSADLQHAVQAVGGTYIDVGQPIATGAGLLQADSEHPTDAGQQVLATAVLADLRAAGIEG